MKLKNLACAMLVVLGLASCTAESDAFLYEVETSVSLEKTFNATCIDYQKRGNDDLNLDQLVPVSTEEALAILQVLRDHKNLTESNSVEAIEGAPGQTFLNISAEQCVDDCHTLELQLQMITYADDNSLFYKGSKTCAKASNYHWGLTGFGLTTNGADGTYKLECTSNLYFKVVEDVVKYIQVPVKLNGIYNPADHNVKFAYSF